MSRGLTMEESVVCKKLMECGPCINNNILNTKCPQLSCFKTVSALKAYITGAEILNIITQIQ